MESWPPATWLLLLIATLDLLRAANGRDFTEQDIIYLHPSTTPFPGGFKCFTCEDARDNFSCNRWAPDVFCPREAKYCYTRHAMNGMGHSLSVTKSCARMDDCLSAGCTVTDQEGEKVCTACCQGNICNLPVPMNETDAVFTTRSPLSAAAGLLQSYALAFSLVYSSFAISS